MPFVSAVNLAQATDADQTDNLALVQAVSGEVSEIARTSGQGSVLDTVDRLDLYETTASVDLEALQVPRRTIKFGA